ncbi:hypothetical protein ASG12_03355 [Williamsia sp. Leaf354]|uniref:hypothetical protein n=1 Tax=Williamsia sp. Leaf354 TaxID=1736349 RepID=UPI0007008754|nr:hypothetical protein [Williamsia sp. Leaf354]KQR99819.1 hypothetical protein ASG12_03355 [Williamsia sp. Leaf354]
MSTPQDPEPIPSLAELDAMDMAEIAAGRTSADKDLRNDDIGPPPRALQQAFVLWVGGAVAALASAAYGLINLGTISDALRGRLEEGIATDPSESAPATQVDSLSSTYPVIMLIAIVVLLAIQYPLLTAIARHHSRNCRSFYVTAVVLMLLCIPVGIDLLFDYPEVSPVMTVIAWVQFALLLLSALFTLRRSVNQWLPEPMRLRPGQMRSRRG